MEAVNRGKKIIIALIVAVILMDVIVISVTSINYMSIGQYNEVLLGVCKGLIRLTLSGILLFFLYKGHRWAKWLLEILLIITSVSFLGLQWVNIDIITLLVGLTYMCSLLILIISKSANTFIRYQRGEITDLQLKCCSHDSNKGFAYMFEKFRHWGLIIILAFVLIFFIKESLKLRLVNSVAKTNTVYNNNTCLPLKDTDFSLSNNGKTLSLLMKKGKFMNIVGLKNIPFTDEGYVDGENKNLKFVNCDYKGLKITFSNMYWSKYGKNENDMVITQLSTEDSKWTTNKGIRPGVPMNNVEKVYGKGTRSSGVMAFTIDYTKDNKFVDFVSDWDSHKLIGKISIGISDN